VHDLRSEPRAARSDAYGEWKADAYLTEYYSRVEFTERFTLRFLRESIRDLSPAARVLDFGSGPTLHHAIALAACAAEVHVADLLPQNLHAIRRWLKNERDAHDWSAFTREVLRLEGVNSPTHADMARREQLVRERVRQVVPGDARRRHPLGEPAAGSYDCVTSFFCADSATSDLGEWMRMMRNIAGLIAPGGLLVIGALRRCQSWRLDGEHLPSACVDERHVQFLLDSAGFERARRNFRVCEVPDQANHGFESILLVSAWAASAPPHRKPPPRIPTATAENPVRAGQGRAPRGADICADEG
jgi:hypothetical protein